MTRPLFTLTAFAACGLSACLFFVRFMMGPENMLDFLVIRKFMKDSQQHRRLTTTIEASWENARRRSLRSLKQIEVNVNKNKKQGKDTTKDEKRDQEKNMKKEDKRMREEVAEQENKRDKEKGKSRKDDRKPDSPGKKSKDKKRENQKDSEKRTKEDRAKHQQPTDSTAGESAKKNSDCNCRFGLSLWGTHWSQCIVCEDSEDASAIQISDKQPSKVNAADNVNVKPNDDIIVEEGYKEVDRLIVKHDLEVETDIYETNSDSILAEEISVEAEDTLTSHNTFLDPRASVAGAEFGAREETVYDGLSRGEMKAVSSCNRGPIKVICTYTFGNSRRRHLRNST